MKCPSKRLTGAGGRFGPVRPLTLSVEPAATTTTPDGSVTVFDKRAVVMEPAAQRPGYRAIQFRVGERGTTSAI
jgi:hypothetical protein